MDAQQFLAEFGHIANAPGGVVRLRELVLALAVQGRLVLQDGSDEPADKQLARIKKIAASTPSTGRRKKTVAAAQRGDLSKPLRRGWTSTRLCDLLRVLNGRAYSRQELLESGTPVLRVGNLFTSDRWYYSNLELEDDKYCDAGDLLFAWSASFGPFIWQGERVIYHYHIWKLDLFSDEEVNKKFLYTWLLEKTQEIKAAGHGISMAHMTKEKFEQLEVGLPPLDEQARIVAKVDELMALCDQLEKHQQNRRKLQNALRQSTLQALASAETPYELQESWQRLQGNIGRLFGEPGDARSLRDVLFDLALRGLLLPDSKLSAAGAPLKEELGSLPSGWDWKTLAELTEYITSGSRGWKAYMSSSGDSFIRSQDIRQDALVFESPAYVTLPERVEGKRTLVRRGDLLLTITGGNVGRCAIVPALTNKAYVSQHVALIRLQDPSLSEFIHFWMVNAFGGRAFLARYIYGDKPGLNLAQVGSVPIPVPPASALTEVLKSLRRYQQLCDALEAQLKAVQEVASKLSGAAVAALTGVAVEKEKDVAVKAPQTELIAPLRLGTLPDVKDLAPLATLLARNQGEMSARDLWQRFGGEIDAFYAQLKTEVAHGWIEDPSYELDAKDPKGPRTYPEGALIAKMKIKQEA